MQQYSSCIINRTLIILIYILMIQDKQISRNLFYREVWNSIEAFLIKHPSKILHPQQRNHFKKKDKDSSKDYLDIWRMTTMAHTILKWTSKMGKIYGIKKIVIAISTIPLSLNLFGVGPQKYINVKNTEKNKKST